MNGEPVYEWRSDLPGSILQTVQAGVLRTKYKGRSFLKSPFDIVLYLQLLQRLRPKTIIEVGTKHGGSALWFADMQCINGTEGRVLSIDIEPPPIIDDPRITLLHGNALHLADALPANILAQLPHPFLVIEDSAHYFDTTLAVMEFFDKQLIPGDYLVVEDGVVAFMPDEIYGRYENGPNRAVDQFLTARQGAYEVDRSLCDFYGYNVTYNPNAWLKKL